MLYEVFDSLKLEHGEDYFKTLVDEIVFGNLNSTFELREYQKEALGRFKFYFFGFSQRQFPAQLLPVRPIRKAR